MTDVVNISAFIRIPFVNENGTLNRESAAALNMLLARVGGAAGVIYADTITNVPAGGIAATDVQAAIAELDFEKQTKDATLTAVAGVPTAADRLIYFTGIDVASACDFTAFARTLVDDANATAARTTLGLATVASSASASDLTAGTLPTARLPALTGDVSSSAGSASVSVDKVSGKAVSLAGTLTTSGAFASTFTMTGVTSVTFPTSGTLAIVNGNIGAASGTSLAVTGALTSSGSSGIGYTTGAGGTVTQSGSKSTGVLLNKASGEITMDAAALAAGAIVSFTLTNSAIGGSDLLIPNHVSGGTAGAYTFSVSCNAGTAAITVRNNTAGSLSEAIVIRFALIKGTVL